MPRISTVPQKGHVPFNYDKDARVQNTSKKPLQPAPYTFDPEILREYDIRGQIGKNLSEADAYAVGLSFGTYVKRKGGKTVFVGYDGRLSSPSLADAMVKGLAATGMDVSTIGRGPTPMLYFAVKDRMADAGVMITGSHNPPDYNGFKMTLQKGSVFGEAVQELGCIAAAGDFEIGEGTVRAVEIEEAYINRLLRDYDTNQRPLNVVWDCGNGSGGDVIRKLAARLPGTHTLLFDKIDGTFPNHHPDPTVDKNLADLIEAVKKNGADLGVAFDGDADRVGAVDEQGTIIRCDMLMTIYAKDVLSRHKHATIIGDVKCSQVMFDEINRLGGNAVMWKTGHSLVKTKMAELKAPLAGELSGHIFFGDSWYGFDDGIYCAIRLLNEVAKAEGPASTLTAHLPKTLNTPEVRFEVDEKTKFAKVKELVESVRSEVKDNKDVQISDIDGIRVMTPHGWWLLRASNTQNVMVTRVEADSAGHLEELKSMVTAAVKKIGYTVSFPA
jgi:phosphomannomutase